MSTSNAKGQREGQIPFILDSSRKSEIFRQTRHSDEARRLLLRIGNHEAPIRNWSRTGLCFELHGSAARYGRGERLDGIVIELKGLVIYHGDIVIRSANPTPDDVMSYGAAFVSRLFPTESIDSADAVEACVERVQLALRGAMEVDPQFCRSVTALRCVLREIQKTCRKEEQRLRGLTYDQRSVAEGIFLPRMTERLKAIFFHFNEQIAAQVDVEVLPRDSVYHQIFHEDIYPFFEGADLVRRAYEKPRGYAGDYEMMNQIYRAGYEGTDLFGRLLHNYITNENSGESVKFRKQYFFGYYNRFIERPGKINALSIACGPAVEVQELVAKWPQADLDRLRITLFDLDREALEHAQTRIFELALEHGRQVQVDFINASVKSFLSSNAETRETFDLVYSGGLFDYLDNATSAALVRKFATLLNPGGKLIIGNFTKENKTKAFLHLLTDWALIHKTEQEMRNWATGIEGVTVDVEYDGVGINAFLVVTRDAAD